MRRFAVLVMAGLLLSACTPAPAPTPVAPPARDPAQEDWYPGITVQLASLNAEAEKLWAAGKFDEAAAEITKGQPLQARLLSAREPTLPAMEAASDLDDLYGRILLRNKQYGWARQTFQKNVIRWKNWKPQTPETGRRLKTALAAVADCDKRMTE